uniref:Uncharacterized protein n=1 Tax=Glossina palpalis gambiensis TaxID=67801 RepID=A0A1B0AYF9_9MUSC
MCCQFYVYGHNSQIRRKEKNHDSTQENKMKSVAVASVAAAVVCSVTPIICPSCVSTMLHSIASHNQAHITSISYRACDLDDLPYIYQKSFILLFKLTGSYALTVFNECNEIIKIG